MKSNPRIAFRTATTLGDVPGHEVGQELQISDIKFSSPAFKVRDEWVYNNFNFVNGSGPHRGVWIDTHEDGAQTFGSCEGTQKTVVTSARMPRKRSSTSAWLFAKERGSVAQHRVAAGEGLHDTSGCCHGVLGV